MKRYSAVLLAAALLFAAGCSYFKSPEISIRNGCGVTIKDVEISGSGFKQSLGTIDSGVVTKVTVKPRDPGPVDLRFTTPEGSLIVGMGLGHVEPRGGSRMTITIAPGYNLETKVDIDNLPPD